MSARRGTTWAATWVPSASPVPGFGTEGYAVCWVDVEDGSRVQVLGAGAPPAPGTRGQIVSRAVGETEIDVFESAAS